MWVLEGFERAFEMLEPLGRMPALENLDVACPGAVEAWAQCVRWCFEGKVECVADKEWCTIFTYDGVVPRPGAA